MTETIITIIFVLFVTAIFTFISFRQKKQAWKGELIKKTKNEDDESGVTYYKLIFKTEEGKKKRVQVTSQKAFDQFNIGDKVEKKSGEYFPTKI